MDIVRVKQIGQELAFLNSSISDYLNKIALEFRQADKDTEVHQLAFSMGVLSGHIMQRIATIEKLSVELKTAIEPPKFETIGGGGSGGVK